MVAEGALSSWRDGPAKKATLTFVDAACGHDGSEPVPPEERIAVFDNDGTLWCEKPVPIQMDFILRRFVEMAQADPALRERQPWKAAYENDGSWSSQHGGALRRRDRAATDHARIVKLTLWPDVDRAASRSGSAVTGAHGGWRAPGGC